MGHLCKRSHNSQAAIYTNYCKVSKQNLYKVNNSKIQGCDSQITVNYALSFIFSVLNTLMIISELFPSSQLTFSEKG